MSCCGFWFGGAGCGTSASKPFGVIGVITMKMIDKNQQNVDQGTTFTDIIVPPLF